MFKINPNPTFTADAIIAVPGKPAAKLKLVFRHKTRAEVKEFCDRVAEAARSSTEPEVGTRDATLLQEIVAGWEEVDQPFTPENFALVLENYHTASQAIFDTYTSEITTARRGN